MQKKGLRLFLIILGALLGLLILLWLALAIYVRQHKAAILQQISGRISERLHGGRLEISDMEPALVRGFPNISVSLVGVAVRDSLWERHRHNLLEVKRIFVKVNTFSLLRHQLDIKQITLEKGSIYLFTDSTGYSNTSVLQRNGRKRNGKGKEADVTGLELEDMQFILDNRQKAKLFLLDIHSLKGRMQTNDSGWTFGMRTDMHIGNFAFNTGKGSYLKDKRLETDLEIHYNRRTKELDIPQQAFRIDGQPVSIGAAFSFAGKPPAFSIHIVAEKMPFRKAASLLSPNISRKLDSIDMQKPLDLEAQLQGHIRFHDTPLVHVTWKTTDNVVTTKGMELDECSFGGGFSNEQTAGMGHNDENSLIGIYGLKARLYGIPVNTDTIRITNLKHPVLTGYFRSDFPLTDLNGAAEDGVFHFSGGTARANLYYKGGITAGDTVIPYLKGTVQLQQGAMEYLPRDLHFSNCSATLDFNGQDLFLQDIRIQSAKSALLMEGSVRNIASLYFAAPEKLLLDWKIRSPMLDLNEFRSFLGKRRQGTHSKAAKRRRMNRIASQLDVMLNSCSVNIQAQLDKLTYNHFSAQQVKANLSLTQTDIRLQQISLSHAGGAVQLSGNVLQDGNNNRFRINAGINNVHIDQLFYAFDNFGMASLKSNNLKGILSAKANISGNVRDNGQMAPHSLYGTVTFDLRQGALVHFAPLEDIGDIAFRRRNMGNITFENLRNTLTLQGSKIIVPPMQINSSALYMDVSGVYGISSGTDMYIDIPLRNPKKDEGITDKEEKKKNRRKGIVLHLHATDDKDGKVKIKLGGKKKDDG